jgi:hypothetical protein
METLQEYKNRYSKEPISSLWIELKSKENQCYLLGLKVSENKGVNKSSNDAFNRAHQELMIIKELYISKG